MFNLFSKPEIKADPLLAWLLPYLEEKYYSSFFSYSVSKFKISIHIPKYSIEIERQNHNWVYVRISADDPADYFCEEIFINGNSADFSLIARLYGFLNANKKDEIKDKIKSLMENGL